MKNTNQTQQLSKYFYKEMNEKIDNILKQFFQSTKTQIINN
jgi:hypothetical protein